MVPNGQEVFRLERLPAIGIPLLQVLKLFCHSGPM